MAPAEGRRRIRPAGQRTPEHCLYGRIHPAYERPRTCRRQPGQLGQLARGRQHDAQRCAALHVGLRARPLGGLHALQLVAAGRHAEQVRRRQPDSVRRGFGAVRRPGKCQRRPVARPGQWLGHDRTGASSAGRATTTTSDTRSARATSPPSIPIRTSTNTRATSTPG